MKKIVSILLSGCLLLSLCSCSLTQREEKYTATVFNYFDTVISITAYDKSREDFDTKQKLIENELERYDRLFDIYNSYEGINNLCTLNSSAGKSPVKVEGDITELLSYGKRAYEITHGAVNICAGAVLKIWHEAREREELPDMNALKNAGEHIDINSLEINGDTVFISDSEASVDVGAIAKGFACDRLREYIKANGLWENYLISLGGNVVAGGYKTDSGNSKWNVEIQNPDLEAKTALEIVSVTDTSVVTSGDYQRFFTVDGVKYCHIINLDTLMPATEFRSVSVICPDSDLADALSTALFILPFSEGWELVKSLDGVEAMWVDNGCEISYTEGFPRI